MVIVSLYALQKPSIKPSASAYPRFGPPFGLTLPSTSPSPSAYRRFGRPFGLTVPSTPPSPSAKTFGFGLSSLRSSEPVLLRATLGKSTSSVERRYNGSATLRIDRRNVIFHICIFTGFPFIRINTWTLKKDV
jgi:hypothetical protein